MNANRTGRRARLQGRVPLKAAGIAVVCMLALLPIASAQASLASAEVTFAKARLSGSVDERSSVDLLYLHREGARPDVNAPIIEATGIVNATEYDLTAYEAEAVIYENTEGAVCMEPLYSLGVRHGCYERTTYLPAAGTATLRGVQSYYTINVLRRDGAPLDLAASYKRADLAPMSAPAMDEGGIAAADPGRASDVGGSSWSRPVVPGDHIETAFTGTGSIDITGNVVVEIVGIDFTLTDGADQRTLHSGTDHQATGPAPAGAMSYHFLRLQIAGGRLHVEMNDDATDLRWTSTQSTALIEGPFALESAKGTVHLDDGQDVALASQTLSGDGSNSLKIAPGSQQLSGQVTRQTVQPQTTVAASAASGPLALAAITAVVLALALAIVALARRRHTPLLAEVEAAIEAGHYRRAARDAGRILRRRPNMEDALLSRAIALCKSGHPERVVREVQAHLVKGKPTDGSLHYVLGLAYLDLGQRPQAEAVFQEALRRTPSLLNDVQGKLGVAGTTTRTPGPLQGPESTHGYA
ncbi:MAG: hypothetical protein V4510_00875 [bacterium]